MLIIILVKLFSSQLIAFLPQALQDYFRERFKLRADQQDHEQAIQIAEQNLLRIKQLSELSKDSFTSEQATALTAELQEQLNTLTDFLLRTVNDKLDILIEKQDFILRELRAKNGTGGTKRLE